MIYLICFGTRPELLKLIPIMTYMDINKIQYKLHDLQEIAGFFMLPTFSTIPHICMDANMLSLYITSNKK